MNNHWRTISREYYNTLDRRYQGRVNYLLVAESMLLLSYVTTYSSFPLYLKDIRIAIAITGISITFYWIVVNIRLSLQMRANQDYLLNDSVYKHIINKVHRNPNAILFLTYIMPSTIIMLWIYLFAYAIWDITISLNLFFWILLIIGCLILIELGIKIGFVTRKCRNCNQIYIDEKKCPKCGRGYSF